MDSQTPLALLSRSVPSSVAPSAVLAARWLTLGALVALTACGGGGDDPEPVPVPALQAASLQGRWVTVSGVSPAQTLLVLPVVEDEASVWSVAADGHTLAQLKLSTSGADGVRARGKLYTLGGSVAPQTIDWQGIAQVAAAGATISLNAGALSLTRADLLNQPIRLADVVGTWRATAGDGTLALQWTVGAQGALSGPSTTGCTYAGTLGERTDATVFNVQLTETCLSSMRRFQGIASARAAQGAQSAALTMALVQDGEAAALLVVLGR